MALSADPTKTFKVHCALEAFEKADDPDGNTMRIGGVVTTDDLDKQGEKIIQQGLDFSPFLTEGWFNDNHGQKTTDVLGYPTGAKFVRKGDRLPNGRMARTNGWWAEGYLLNTEQGRQTWQLCQALSKSPRQLGFSIEGKVKQRSSVNDAVITRAIVKNVAITHCPVNTGTEMHALAKALTAGSAISNPGSAPGEGFVLRTESASHTNPSHGDEVEDIEDVVEGRKMEHLTPDPGDDANNGGWAGLNPHTTEMRSPAKGTPPGTMAKADTDAGDFRIVDELDLIEEWAPILNRQLDEMQPPGRLSKAESRIIVAQRFPHLTLAEVDAIVDHAATT